MTYGIPAQGFSRGALRGLELARRHNLEDEQAARAEELHGLQTEQARLGIDEARGRMTHRERMRPIEERRARLGLRGSRQQLRLADLELEAAERAQETEQALRHYAAGNLGAAQDWYNRYAHNDITEIGRALGGKIRLTYSDGDTEELTDEDLGARMAALADPEGWLTELAQDPEVFGEIEYHPGLGWGQFGPDGEWHPKNPEEGGVAAGGSGSDTSEQSLMERIARNFWGRMNENGEFFLPEGSQENYIETFRRIHELRRVGVPMGDAADIAAMSIKGPLEEAEARGIAEREAQERYGLSVSSQERQERADFIRQRTAQLVEGSLGAQREYERLLREGGRRSGSTSEPPVGAIPAPAASGSGGPTTGEPRGGPGALYTATDRNGEQVTVTWAEIRATAEKHGKTPEEVISDLGLQRLR